jgi:hypothetical protein
VAGSVLAFAVAAWASASERDVTFVVRGAVERLRVDVADADVDLVRGGDRDSVEVRRVERFSFSRAPAVQRRLEGATFVVRARCPAALLDGCGVRLRVVVPDGLPVEVRTSSGAVRLRDLRGSARVATRDGDVRATGFCGFSLQADSDHGRLAVGTSCAPQQLALRSTTGDVRAVVPAGRYRLDVDSASGRRAVRGISAAAGAPFAVRALSGSGDVTVEAPR